MTEADKPCSAKEQPSSETELPIPHALDGSQYHNIIEEQAYAEQPPSPEEQKPWRIFHPESAQSGTTATNETSISVGVR